MKPGDIILLENTRFHAGETKNDEALSKELASLGDVYVSDAFGSVHRAHASTEGVTRFVGKSAAGYLRRELGANMSLRYTPELQFIADDSIEYGAHILEMLRDVRVVKPANPENETLNTEDEQE